jgi:hypothetical protein
MADKAQEIVQQWLTELHSDKPQSPRMPGALYGGLSFVPDSEDQVDQPFWRGRQEFLRRSRPTTSWTTALSDLYVSDKAREHELKNILDDYMTEGRIDDESMKWLQSLPRRQEGGGGGWLYGARGPTEEALAKLKEDLIWEAAAMKRRQQMDWEWEGRQVIDREAANFWADQLHRKALEDEAAKKAAMSR